MRYRLNAAPSTMARWRSQQDCLANALKLVIGNKNYSSWSMRPWLALRANNIPFEEVFIPLYTDDTADKERILSFSPCGQGAGADRRRRHGVGFAGDHRISRRDDFRKPKLWPEDRARARACALDFGGDAFGLHGAAQRMRHEPASAGRRRSRCRTMRAPMSRGFRRSGPTAARATARTGRSCSARSAARTRCLRRSCIASAPMRSRSAPRGAALYRCDDGVAGVRRNGPATGLPKPS